jgi:hypothetical protein
MLGLLKINSSIYSVFEATNTTSNIDNYYTFCIVFFFQNTTFDARIQCNILILFGYYPDGNDITYIRFRQEAFLLRMSKHR